MWFAASELRRQPAGLRSWRRDSTVLLALWIVVPVSLAFTKSMVSLSVFTNRNLMICLAPLLLLLARGVTVLPLSRPWRTALGVLLPVVFLLHLVFVRDYYEKPTKVGYRGAVQAVLTGDPAGAVPVVGCRSAYYYDYYFAQLGSDRRVGLVVLVEEDRKRLLDYLEQSGQDSFWLVQGWFFPPEPGLQAFLDRAFEVVERVKSTRAKATLYRRRAQGSE